jgi:predicted glycosyltransferase
MRVWVDLSNSPHPLLFAPVVRRLQIEGHQVLVTARDNAQTPELAYERWPDVEVIGGPSPMGTRAKTIALAGRIVALRRWAKASRPDVALSHNSYAQLVAAYDLRIPAVTAMDFEHQPANHLAFRLAKTVLLPSVLPLRTVRRQGAAARKVVHYPGLKEELYLGDFQPNPMILTSIGVEPRPQTVIVARTPPSRAVYHSFGNPLFEDALRTACAQQGVVCVALARYPEQIAAIDALGLSNCVVPGSAIDSRSLMYAADAMIGAGGTMTREAALIGIPTWTVFAGKTPAVDMWLEEQGLLKRVTTADQLRDLGPRRQRPRSPADFRRPVERIERVIVSAALAACDDAHAYIRCALPTTRGDGVSPVRRVDRLPHTREHPDADGYSLANRA